LNVGSERDMKYQYIRNTWW